MDIYCDDLQCIERKPCAIHQKSGVAVADPPDKVPQKALNAVLKVNPEDLPKGTPTVVGPDFNQCVTLDSLMQSYATVGFQATQLARAIAEVNRMLKWRQSDEPRDEDDEPDHVRAKVKCTIFLGYTSNMISCGVRESLRYIVQHKMVSCLVTTCGGIEEDFIKIWNPHYVGDFTHNGRELRLKGQNRIANLIVPNKNYCEFEDWIMPILDAMLDEQKTKGVRWTPSRLIDRLGKEINNEDSVYYWAHKNKIPVYSPAITDGSIGDMLYFHSFRNPGLIIDLVEDIRGINDQAMQAEKSGMIILGGGLIKHHICNANLMRNGADFSVFINTGSDYDGSDAGAPPDEAVSWGKIKIDATPVKVHCDASIAFPLLVSQTFVKTVQGGH
jgi:deoxyhypusine synthase